MEIKHLKTLLAVIRCGTFEKAALELNYSQSTITFQMKQLESDLGFALFEKVGRNLRLSDDARVLMPKILRLCADYDELVNFSMPLAEMTGTYTIAVAESLLLYKLAPLLQRFHQLLPKMDLAVAMVTNDALEAQVQTGNADIGLYYQNTTKRAAAFNRRHWASYETVLVGRPDLTAAAQVTRISGDLDSNYDRAYSAALAAGGRSLVTLNLGSVTAAKAQILAGTGIGVLPAFMVQAELAAGTLVALGDRRLLPRVDVVSLTRAGQASGRVTRRVEGLLHELAW